MQLADGFSLTNKGNWVYLARRPMIVTSLSVVHICLLVFVFYACRQVMQLATGFTNKDGNLVYLNVAVELLKRKQAHISAG